MGRYKGSYLVNWAKIRFEANKIVWIRKEIVK